MGNLIEDRLAAIAESLERSKVDLPLELKLKTAEMILLLMSRRKCFGLYVILGWRGKWKKYLDLPDIQQDIFSRHHLNVMNIRPGEHRRYDMGATINFDGAILIDRHGNFIHSGVLIEGIRPRVVAERVNPGRFHDLSEQFGFAMKVHTRHLTAVASSFVFKGTTVYTVSEESGNMHIYENGLIVHRR